MAELSDILGDPGSSKEKPSKSKAVKEKPSKPKVVIDIKDYALEAVLSAVLGLYAAFVFWDVWSIGVKGLGFNATIFIYALTALLIVTRTKERPLAYRDLTWIAPSLVIALSFSLYENDFFEPLNCFIFPAVLIWNFVVSSNHFWGRLLSAKQALAEAGIRILSILFASFVPAWTAYISVVSRSSNVDSRTVKRVTQGVCLLIVISAVVIWLLFSADRVFAFRIWNLGTWIVEVFDTSIFLKIPVAVLIAVALLGICIRQKSDAPDEGVAERTPIDSLVSGIVLSGVLVIYFLFLFVQAEKLWMDSLPIELDEITSLVKTGFWQLVALSLINVFGFMLLYRTTNRTVQILLSVFVVASTLVLSSSAHKLYLYIASTGLSYEKFYSSYVVLFCGLLLTLLFWFSFKKKLSDTVRSTLLLFTVMYSVVSVVPVNQLVYAVNTELAESEDASQWLKGGAWREELPISVELLDTGDLLDPSLTDVAKEKENLEDFKSLLKIIHRVDSREVEKTQWCIQLLESSGDSRIRLGHQCVVDSTHTEEHGKAWVVDVGDIDDWRLVSKSSFAKKFWVLRHSEIMKQDLLSATRDLEANLRAGLIERIHRAEHTYKWLTNSKYMGELWQYCITESKLISHISPKGCHQLRGLAFTMTGPKSDPVFVPRNLYSANFFVVTRADLLTKLRPPSVPRVVEKTLAMLWHQKSFQAFKIERALEFFSGNQKEKKKELLKRFNNLEKKQKEAREKLRNEVSEMGPKSVFMKFIE